MLGVFFCHLPEPVKKAQIWRIREARMTIHSCLETGWSGVFLEGKNYPDATKPSAQWLGLVQVNSQEMLYGSMVGAILTREGRDTDSR